MRVRKQNNVFIVCASYLYACVVHVDSAVESSDFTASAVQFLYSLNNFSHGTKSAWFLFII